MMSTSKIIHAAVVGIVGAASFVGLAGCAGNSGNDASVKGLTSEDADKMNGNRSQFERSEDPPYKPDTWFAAGQLAEAQGAGQIALQDYNEALKLDPKHGPSLYRTGVVYSQAKMYPQAIETWKRYILATNGAGEGYSNLGFCYELAGKNAEAENAYRQGLVKHPDSGPCHMNYGLMLARTNRVPQALEQLQMAVSPAEAHYDVGSVFEQQGKKADARAEYQKALELNPKMDDAKTRLAHLN